MGVVYNRMLILLVATPLKKMSLLVPSIVVSSVYKSLGKVRTPMELSTSMLLYKQPILGRSFVGNHSCYEFMMARPISCPEVNRS